MVVKCARLTGVRRLRVRMCRENKRLLIKQNTQNKRHNGQPKRQTQKQALNTKQSKKNHSLSHTRLLTVTNTHPLTYPTTPFYTGAWANWAIRTSLAQAHSTHSSHKLTEPHPKLTLNNTKNTKPPQNRLHPITHLPSLCAAQHGLNGHLPP